jgi:hypothetical protein
MPTFEITDPLSGKTLEITGDSPPTEVELEEIFSTVSPAVETAPIQETTEQPGFFRTLRGEAELAGTILSTGVLEPIAGAAGIVQSLNPFAEPGAATRAVEAIQSLSFKPGAAGIEVAKSIGEIAKDITPEVVQDFISFVGEEFKAAQESAFQKFGPIGGTAVAIAPAAALEAIPGFFAIKKARNIPTTRADEAIDQTQDAAREAGETTFKTEIQPEAKDLENISSDLKKEKTQNLIDAIQPDPEILQSAKNLQVDLNPSHYSTNRAFIEMEQGLKSKPGSTLSTIEERAILKAGEKADELIVDLGGQVDKSLLEANIKNDIQSSIVDLEKQGSIAYAKVNKQIPKNTKVNANTANSYIGKRLDDLGGDVALLNKSEKELLRMSKLKNNPTYGGLDQVRRNVGEALSKKSGPFQNDEEAILNQVYGALSNDQQGVADAFGVGADYEFGRKMVSTRKDLEGEALTLFGRDIEGSILPKLSEAAGKLTKGDISLFNKLMKALPKGRRKEAAATMLNEFFASGQRKKTAIGGGFATAFQSLNRNQGAKKIIFDELGPDAEKTFNDLGRVATGIFRAKAFENPSGTARGILNSLDDGSLIQKIVGTKSGKAGLEVSGQAIGLPGVGLATGFGLDFLTRVKGPKTKAASELLTSFSFKKSLEDAALGKTVSAEQIQNTKVFKNWLTAQPPDIRGEIAAIGFIPWLTQDQPELE